MKETKLTIRPLRQGLLAGVVNEIDVLVSVEAPDAPADLDKKRPPLNLALVIDRSGSMAGPPLHEAKRCAAHIVGRLTEKDRVAVVEYDDQAGLVVPSQAVIDSQPVCARIEAIQEGGTTNLHGGWLTGAGEVSPHVHPQSISRVILLSDGIANRGLTDRSVICQQCEQLAAAGVTTSTYGLGKQFDESLMTGMARAGRGNAYYGHTAEDLFDPIEEELQLLSALYARTLRLRYRGTNGANVRVVNPFTCPAPDLVDLPDLAYDSGAWVMLRIAVPAHRPLGNSRSKVDILEVSAEYTLTDATSVRLPPVCLSLPVLPSEVFEGLSEDKRVRSRAAELEVVRFEREAREAAQRRDWVQVDHLMNLACEAGADSDWAMRTVHALREIARERDIQRMSKESHYAAFRQEKGLSSKSGIAPHDLARIRYLREKALQGTSEE